MNASFSGGWLKEKTRPMNADSEKPVAGTAKADRILIFDTTLRDGEQCPGATMNFEEKLEVADCLDALGVENVEVLHVHEGHQGVGF